MGLNTVKSKLAALAKLLGLRRGQGWRQGPESGGGQIAEFISQYQKPGDPDYHNNQGIALRMKDDLDGAIREYQEAIRLKPDDVMFHCNLASVWAQKGDYHEAIRVYRLAIGFDPSDYATRFNLGNLYRDMERHEEALGEYQRAVELDPQNAAGHYALAGLYWDQEKIQESAPHYHRALELDSNDSAAGLAYQRLGVHYLEQKAWDRAEDYLLEALDRQGDNFTDHFCLAGVYLYMEKDVEPKWLLPAKAVGHARKALEIQPGDADATAIALAAQEAFNEARGAEKEEQQTESDRVLPRVKEDLDRIRNEPICELSIEIDPDTFPIDQSVVLELQLTMDSLWTQPISFYFALYREGQTWPKEFGFEEPSYTHYYKEDFLRVAVKFKWFDRVMDLDQIGDATDLRDQPAMFSLTFDSEQFQPGNPGIHLPQTFEVPSLRRLRDQGSEFRLVAHYSESESAEFLDLEETGIDVRVQAVFKGLTPPAVTVFHSVHDQFESAVLGCDYLLGIDNAIEREALLWLYPPTTEAIRQARSEKLERIGRLAQSGVIPSDDEDKRLVARLLESEARLAAFRGLHRQALTRLAVIGQVMDALIFRRIPTYEDGMLMYRVHAQTVDYHLNQKDYQSAGEANAGAGLVTQRLVDAAPDEPDYRRVWAETVLTRAVIHAESGDMASAAEDLRRSVDCWRQLYAELPNPARSKDAQEAMSRGLERAAGWGVESGLPLAEWRTELGLEGLPETQASPGRSEGSEDPVWVEAVELEDWPTQPIESSMLRYSLRVPEGWTTTAAVNQLPMEVEHIYRGPSPAEWLIVCAMDQADPESNMKNWVEVVVAMSGFPSLTISTALDPRPELSEWRYEGSSQALARKLDVDEVHLYCGLAKLPGQFARLARIYILMARRAGFGWKLILSFESGSTSDMPEAFVAANDHVRAGAIFGYLSLQ